MELALDGRVAAITGASSGIGEATARALAEAGAAVALGARRVDRIEALAADIGDRGGKAVAIPTDVSDKRQASSFILGAAEQLGRLDILVNNAGVMLLGPVDNADIDGWERMIGVNVFGVLYCTHAALPIMKDQGGGHIVNVSSVAGRRAAAGVAVYNLTKFGVNAFSEALRQEGVDANVRVTVVEPAFVQTELRTHSSEQVQKAQEDLRLQIGEVLTPVDVATSIVEAVSRPPRVNIHEILMFPTGQR
jgi:NADP-dependent 3-hydroxy acid dehydrogenase YdfG